MSDCSSPCELVTDGWSTSRSYASNAFNSANSYLETLQNAIDPELVTEIPNVSVNVDMPDGEISNIVIPDVPTPGSISFSAPTAPSAPELSSVSQINPPTVPTFIGSFPTINLPAAPEGLTAIAPDGAPEFTMPTIPDAPEYDIPGAPTLRDLDLPDAPDITLPDFLATAPEDNLVAPEAQMVFSEDMYASNLLTEINDKLQTDIVSGTAGLPEITENMLWDRARSREHMETQRGKKRAVEEFAGRGFTLPTGALAARLREAEQDAVNKSVSLSREVYINQAERALQQMQFALTTALQKESQLMDYSNSVAQRAFEAQNALLQASVQIFNGKVQLYTARVSAYSAYADVFKTQIDAELSKLRVFESELSAQKLIGEMNLQDLEAYKTSLTAIESIVEVYKTETQAAGVQADVQRLGLEAFKGEVDAYKAQIEAKATEYGGYKTRVDSELAKVKLFEGEVDAYNGQINGYKAYVDTLSIINRSDIEVNKSQLDIYLGRLQAFKTQTDAEATRIKAEATSFDAEVRAFSAELGAQESRVKSEATEQQLKMSVASTEANLEMKQAELNIQKSINALELLVEALKSGATVSSGLAQAALSAVNLSGSISGSSSDSTSTSHIYNY